MMQTNLYVCAALIFFGMLCHFVKKLWDLEQAGTILSPKVFLRLHPYQVSSAVLGAYMLGALCYFTGQLNEAASIFIGVGAGSALESLRAKAVGKIHAQLEEAGK